ncbi:unnamed protein product [Psylliodes chrysocephalus]|uniref:BED-type domain-containing protein n=1 Tax=Psylliodes chrysocephalus TaxID=3402493 RepID=A0A9P0DDE5_9CUCU|nr:unnamed protein product [Psylliodes chrysocephala]
MFKKRKNSYLWNFYSELYNTFAKCNICAVELSYRTSTTNLRRHMQSKHPTVSLNPDSGNSNNLDGILFLEEDSDSSSSKNELDDTSTQNTADDSETFFQDIDDTGEDTETLPKTSQKEQNPEQEIINNNSSNENSKSINMSSVSSGPLKPESRNTSSESAGPSKTESRNIFPASPGPSSTERQKIFKSPKGKST